MLYHLVSSKERGMSHSRVVSTCIVGSCSVDGRMTLLRVPGLVGEPRHGAGVQFLGTWVSGQQLHFCFRCGSGHPSSPRPRALIGEGTLPVHAKVATSMVLSPERDIWSPCIQISENIRSVPVLDSNQLGRKKVGKK